MNSPSKLVHNERVKLTAAAMNTLATTMVGTGLFAPSVAYTLGLYGTASVWTIVVFGAIWLLAGAGTHLGARRSLKELRE